MKGVALRSNQGKDSVPFLPAWCDENWLGFGPPLSEPLVRQVRMLASQHVDVSVRGGGGGGGAPVQRELRACTGMTADEAHRGCVVGAVPAVAVMASRRRRSARSANWWATVTPTGDGLAPSEGGAYDGSPRM